MVEARFVDLVPEAVTLQLCWSWNCDRKVVVSHNQGTKLRTHQSLSCINVLRSSSSSRRGTSDTGAYCVCETSGSVDGFKAIV